MLAVNQLTGFGAGGSVPPATISKTADAKVTTSLTTYTFSGQAIGTAAANRTVIVGAAPKAAGGNPTIASVTIGGVSATLVKAVLETTGGIVVCEIWEADVPSGTTADVVIVLDNAGTGFGIAVWAAYGIGAAHAVNSDAASDPLTATLDIPAGGVAVGVVGTTTTSSSTFVWTNLTESVDEIIQVNASYGAAQDAFAASQTALLITANPSGSTVWAMVVASWTAG